jgi:hypothetical protein
LAGLGAATGGNTTRSIGAVRPIETGRRRIGLEAQRAEIPWATGRRARGNSWVDKAVISPAIAGVAQVSGTGQAEAERIG